MLSEDFNYVGIGVARRARRPLYTVVFVLQRDHTPPKAGLVASATGISVAATVEPQARDRQVVGPDPILQRNTPASAASPSSTAGWVARAADGRRSTLTSHLTMT